MGGEIYKIELYEETNFLGYIQFYHHKNKISILSIKVFEQRKKYGSLLLLIIINYINNYITNSYFIKEIFLDDCSDLALTKQTIYFKFAYRIMDKTNPEKMSLKFLTPKPTKKQLNRYYPYNEDISKLDIPYYKTIIHYYNELLQKYKHLLNENMSIKTYNNNEEIILNLTKIFKI
jgi:hypothetical protein